MTLIIAALCSDGAVVAADSHATNPIMRMQVKKIDVVDSRAIVGIAGAPTVGDRISALLTQNLAALTEMADELQAREALRQLLWAQVIQPELQHGVSLESVPGRQGATQQFVCEPVFALPLGTKPSLICVDANGQAHHATVNRPYFALGSGLHLGAPFVEFARRLLWPDGGLPSLAVAIRTCWWALHHAIETNSGGVGAPIRLAILSADDAGVLSARELSEAEVDEHKQACVGAERAMASYFDMESADPDSPPPDVPAPQP